MARFTSLLCALPVMLALLRQAAYHWPTVWPVCIKLKRRARAPVLGVFAPLTTVITLALNTVVVPGLWVAVLTGAVFLVFTICLLPYYLLLCRYWHQHNATYRYL